MALMDEAVRAVAEAAGWKSPEPGKDGAYRFRLEGGLDFALFSPDGRSCVMRGEVGSLPPEGMEREDALAEAARRQVGVCRVRPSVLALEEAGQSRLADGKAPADGPREDTLVLYRQVRLEAGRADRLAAELREFLNDLDWWRAARKGRAEPAPAFGMAGMGAGVWMGGLR